MNELWKVWKVWKLFFAEVPIFHPKTPASTPLAWPFHLLEGERPREPLSICNRTGLPEFVILSCRDPLVHKLILWRHNAIAHRGYEIAKGNRQVLDNSPFTGDDWVTLIDRSFDILNRYAFLFDARSYSVKLIGEDDYKDLFHFLRLGLKKHDEDLDREIRGLV